MRFAVLAFVALVATGCSGQPVGDPGLEAAPETILEISVTPGGEAPTKVWTLRCPSGERRQAAGTLPDAAQACEQLETLDDPFAPVPTSASCTQVYGGPQEADVRGVYKGRRVKAHFDRGNGCEIARWDKVAFLFPPG